MFRKILADRYGPETVEDFPLETFQAFDKFVALRQVVRKRGPGGLRVEESGVGMLGLFVITFLVLATPLFLLFGREIMDNLDLQGNVKAGRALPLPSISPLAWVSATLYRLRLTDIFPSNFLSTNALPSLHRRAHGREGLRPADGIPFAP